MAKLIAEQRSILRILKFALLLPSIFITLPITPPLHAQTYTVLYNFNGGADGKTPFGSLLYGPAGNLYGTTQYGGGGYGLVFKLDPDGNQTVLHSFSGVDGSDPKSGLLRYGSVVYGTTSAGGTHGAGVLFSL